MERWRKDRKKRQGDRKREKESIERHFQNVNGLKGFELGRDLKDDKMRRQRLTKRTKKRLFIYVI